MNLDPELFKLYNIVDWGYTESSHAISFDKFHHWTEQGHHGSLGYLIGERKDKRESLKNYFPEFQSALVFLFDYRKIKKSEPKNLKQKIASYVLGFKGQDYHNYLREALNQLYLNIKEQYPNILTMLSLDTQPILERDLAYRAGLGWFGKNSMLISREHGSYFIIGALLLNEKLIFMPKEKETDHCGTCSACIDACPTEAILDSRTLDTEKCISTFTIEHFKDIDAPKGFEKTNWIFGCDICQEVCPWNEKALENVDPVEYNSELVNYFSMRNKEVIIKDLNHMSNRQFRKIFRNTPLERTGREGLLKNLLRN